MSARRKPDGKGSTGDPPPERLWTVRETAAYLHCSAWAVRRWIANKKLPHLRVGRCVRIDPRDLRLYLEAAKEEVDLSGPEGGREVKA